MYEVMYLITEKLTRNMRVLFIGFNPSLTSYERGFNYAGRSNRFYKILFLSGLTNRLYQPEESPALLEDYGYGFTNIVARPTKRADELTSEEYAEGRKILKSKLSEFRPKVACYVGKGVYAQFSGKHQGVPWGFQADEIVESVTDFVGPSSSGLVRMKLEEQVAIYKLLSDSVKGF